MSKIFYLPDNFAEIAKIPGRGLLLRRSNHLVSEGKSKGGIWLPDQSDSSYEKKFDIGEVIDAGPECKCVEAGDIVIYQKETAFRIPDATRPDPDNPRFVRIDETSQHVIAYFKPGAIPEEIEVIEEEPEPEQTDTVLGYVGDAQGA